MGLRFLAFWFSGPGVHQAVLMQAQHRQHSRAIIFEQAIPFVKVVQRHFPKMVFCVLNTGTSFTALCTSPHTFITRYSAGSRSYHLRLFHPLILTNQGTRHGREVIVRYCHHKPGGQGQESEGQPRSLGAPGRRFSQLETASGSFPAGIQVGHLKSCIVDRTRAFH